MTSYDSIFTDNLFFGTKKLNLADSNSLNNKLWTVLEIPTDLILQNNPSKYSSFFTVKTFTKDESDIITEAFDDRGRDYRFNFDDYGNIEILKDNISLLKSPGYNYFKNPISYKTLEETNKQSIFVNKDPNKSKYFYRDDMIISNNKQWILFKKDGIFKLLYNPIHRQSFKNFYNNTPNKDSSGLTSSLRNLVNQYCEIVAEPGDTTPVRRYADNSCNCLQYNDCIDDVTNTNIKNNDYRNKMSQNCVCYAPSCDTNLSVDPSSFMFDSYVPAVKSKISTDGKCPEIKNIVCQVNLSAEDLKLVDSKITQQCGDKPIDTDTSTSPPLSTSKPSTTIHPSSSSKPIPESSLSIPAIIGIIFGLGAVIGIIIFLVVYFKKKKI